MIGRIEQLRAEAESEISAAGSSEALEQLRVRHLGRKAELPQLLRGVAQLDPDGRAAVGKAANAARRPTRRARRSRRCSPPVPRSSADASCRSVWRTTAWT